MSIFVNWTFCDPKFTDDCDIELIDDIKNYKTPYVLYRRIQFEDYDIQNGTSKLKYFET